MKEYKLSATHRTRIGKKVKQDRRGGFIPAVLYGGTNQRAVPLLVGEGDFLKMYRQAGASSLIALSIGAKDVRNVLVHDVARHPVSDRFLHVDFYEVRMDEKLKATVPFVFIGEAPAVKNDGGHLVKTLQEVDVECLPKDLPHELSVDISSLTRFGSSIRIKDLVLPAGVAIHGMDGTDMVVLVEEPRAEEEVASMPVADEQAVLSAIKTEVEEKREKKVADEEKAST